MPLSRAIAASFLAGSLRPLTLETSVKVRTLVRSEHAFANSSTTCSSLSGTGGTATRMIFRPKRLARMSQASLLVTWFCSQMTISSPARKSRPLVMTLLPSEVLRTSATSSGAAPMCAATLARDCFSVSLNCARLLKETS